MKIAAKMFSSRTLNALTAAGVKPAELKNIAKYPLVQKRFHLITAHALQVLDRDPILLARLQARFEHGWELTRTLVADLEAKKLTLRPYGEPVAYYGLSGTAVKDQARIVQMETECAENPLLEDIAIILERFDIELVSHAGLNPQQVKNLNLILSPGRPVNIFQLLVDRVSLIEITASATPVVTQQKTGDKIYLQISADLLTKGMNLSELGTMLAAALK
jgi:hypothetical protein